MKHEEKCSMSAKKIAMTVFAGCFVSSVFASVPQLPDAAHSCSNRTFCGVSSVAVSPSGNRLWATFYASPTGWEDSNNYIVLATSEDRGDTWRDVLVYDPDGIGSLRAFDSEVWVSPDGKLRWTYTERKAPLCSMTTDRNKMGGSCSDDRLLMFTLDAEVVQSDLQLKPQEIAKGVMMCKPIARCDGQWLLPIARWFKSPSALVYESDDSGRSFQYVGGVSLPANVRTGDEHNIVELSDGRLRAYMRTRQPHNSIWQADSLDGGRSWGDPVACSFNQSPARIFVRRLKSGALLLVKNGPLDKDVGRKNLMAYLSRDDGKTWLGGLVLAECAEPSAYPDGDQGPDGTIYLTWDGLRTECGDIHLARFTESDVLGGCLKGDSRRDLIVTQFPSAIGRNGLPVVDISGETARQVVIAEGTKDRYEGHPTTLLAEDGKTMFCVWTTGHGGPCGPMARSDDGAKTWMRVDDLLPSVYTRTHKNCPVLQKIKGPDGKMRYFIFSAKAKDGTGLGIMMSEDLGKTWSELACQPQLSSGMPPTGVMELANGDIALFGQRFKALDQAKDRPTDDQAVWMAISKDGGRTYGEMRNVMESEKCNLCEPCCLRSPDGRSLLLIARENRHKGRSKMSFSHDEGLTWSNPVDTPWALTGDRHEGVLLPDGRYVIAFRDQAIGSVTKGQFVAWVGTFDDLANGRSGQCRIHLLRHYPRPKFPGGFGDTGYPGVELLANGEIVCTTYVRYCADDRQNSVVCTRFRMAEIDARLK